MADVLIAGLGPSGAAAAIRLAQAGLRVVAVDRAAFPRDKICSEFMSPETVRQLDRLGVLPEVLRHAVPLHGTRVFGPRGSSLTGLFANVAAGPQESTGISLPRRILDAILVDAARRAGVRVLERIKLVDLIRDGGQVKGAMVSQGSRTTAIPARLVIGADGLHSVTARLLGGRRFEPLRRYGFVAHVAGVPDLDLTEMHVAPDCYVGLNRIGDDLANVAVVSALGTRGSALGAAEFFFRTIDRFERVRGRVRPGAVVRRVMTSGPFAVWSRRVTTDGALLLGDAADFFDPFTGEGICTALRGAALAAPVAIEALAAAEFPSARHLEPYRLARRRAFGGKWIVERMIGYGMLAPSLFDRAVGRLERRGMAHTLVGVTGDILPARAVLNPLFLSAMVI